MLEGHPSLVPAPAGQSGSSQSLFAGAAVPCDIMFEFWLPTDLEIQSWRLSRAAAAETTGLAGNSPPPLEPSALP